MNMLLFHQIVIKMSKLPYLLHNKRTDLIINLGPIRKINNHQLIDQNLKGKQIQIMNCFKHCLQI